MQFSSTFDDGADCTGDNESSYGTGMFKKATLRYLKWTNYVVDGREKFSTIAWDPLYIGNLSGSAVITNIKSSNKHFTARKGVGVNAIYVEEKPDYVIKDGIKTTISFNVTQNGRTYKLSSRITFKPYGAFLKALNWERKIMHRMFQDID